MYDTSCILVLHYMGQCKDPNILKKFETYIISTETRADASYNCHYSFGWYFTICFSRLLIQAKIHFF